MLAHQSLEQRFDIKGLSGAVSWSTGSAFHADWVNVRSRMVVSQWSSREVACRSGITVLEVGSAEISITIRFRQCL